MDKMDTKDYFKILREIKDTSIATIDENGMPQVRIIDTMMVEDDKLYFLTARGKDFYRQLMANGYVAITGLNDKWETVRVWGRVKNVGQDLLDKIFEDNPSMNGVYPGETRDILEVFCLFEGEGEYFCLAQEPIERLPFSFGGSVCHGKGFIISDACIGCRNCKSACPQDAIDEGDPYQIRQSNCLHCGRCFELCPVGAIKHRG